MRNPTREGSPSPTGRQSLPEAIAGKPRRAIKRARDLAERSPGTGLAPVFTPPARLSTTMQLVRLTPGQPAPDLAAALGRSVRTPVEAIRIILEDLTRGTTDGDAMPAAIDTLARVRSTVQAIEDFYQPTSTYAMRCTLGEVTGGVRGSLSEAHRSRLMVALDAAPATLLIDGPLLVKSLVRLIDNALEADSAGVMLHVTGAVAPGSRPNFPRASSCTFSVVGRGGEPFDFDDMVRPFHSNKRGHVGLGLTLAARDVERLGGRLSLETSVSGATRFTFELDCAGKAMEAA
jgi:signal transduction histidine kinase